MSSASPSSAPACSQCGAVLALGAERCWLCASESQPAGVHGTTPVAAPVPPVPPMTYSLASLLMLVTLASVVLGVSTIAPGIGIPLGIVSLVVWIRTAAVARRRLAHGAVISRAERTQLFLASFGVTFVLLAIVCVSGCAAYFAACFACLGTATVMSDLLGREVGTMAGYTAYAVVGLGIVGVTLWWVIRIVRRRWRRDTGSDSTDTRSSR